MKSGFVNKSILQIMHLFFSNFSSNFINPDLTFDHEHIFLFGYKCSNLGIEFT